MGVQQQFPCYAQVGDGSERRRANVALYRDGWNARSIAGYLGLYCGRVMETFTELGGM